MYSNFSLLDLSEKDIQEKEAIWKNFWNKNKSTLKKKINGFILKKNYNEDAFNKLIELIESKNKFTSLFTNEENLNLTRQTNSGKWIAKSMLTIKQDDTDQIINILNENGIKYIDKESIANNMLQDIKENFNFLFFFVAGKFDFISFIL